MPAKYCATEIDKNHTPIIRPTTLAIESLVIMLNPTVEMHNSASEWIRYSPASHHSPTWKLVPVPAKLEPNTSNRKPAPTPIRAMANLAALEGSRPRLARTG